LSRVVDGLVTELEYFNTSVNLTEQCRVVIVEAFPIDRRRFRPLVLHPSLLYVFKTGWDSEMGVSVSVFSLSFSVTMGFQTPIVQVYNSKQGNLNMVEQTVSSSNNTQL